MTMRATAEFPVLTADEVVKRIRLGRRRRRETRRRQSMAAYEKALARIRHQAAESTTKRESGVGTMDSKHTVQPACASGCGLFSLSFPFSPRDGALVHGR